MRASRQYRNCYLLCQVALRSWLSVDMPTRPEDGRGGRGRTVDSPVAFGPVDRRWGAPLIGMDRRRRRSGIIRGSHNFATRTLAVVVALAIIVVAPGCASPPSAAGPLDHALACRETKTASPVIGARLLGWADQGSVVHLRVGDRLQVSLRCGHGRPAVDAPVFADGAVLTTVTSTVDRHGNADGEYIAAAVGRTGVRSRIACGRGGCAAAFWTCVVIVGA